MNENKMAFVIFAPAWSQTIGFVSNEPHGFIYLSLHTANVSFLFICSCLRRAVPYSHQNQGTVTEIFYEIAITNFMQAIAILLS